ncbi:TetR/AcrR family transcriptional regulator [Subtercola lobariae]|uniref:TetR/AcrR family transcriptional regulator n=1 Tax=Subtercola lobariae TaxID=1588641 RepID=UPI00194227FB|nr:TetR/AcrR family transcriptional regulator [Subtercola lobariae]
MSSPPLKSSHSASPAHGRTDAAEELRVAALRLFVETSYAGTSLQQIADAAGYSKSSVLYHFASKEALLEAALAPAVERLGVLLAGSVGRVTDTDLRAAFVDEFIDYLLEYRLEAHIIINQGQSLAGIATIDRAREWIARLATAFDSEVPSVSQRIRIGVGLAGAAYVLATSAVEMNVTDSIAEVRAALIDVVSELVVPAAVLVPSPTSASPNRLTL